jgi:hypothetical protein
VTQAVFWLDLDLRHPAGPNTRLIVALLVASSVHVALIVFWRFDSVAPGVLDAPLVIDVTVRRQDADIDVPPADPPIRSDPPAVPAPTKPKPAAQDRSVQSEAAAEPSARPAISLQEITTQAITNVLDQQDERRGREAEKWAATRSVMFRPPPQLNTEEAPILPGLDLDGRSFQGFGVKVFNCFLGLPAHSSEDVDTDAHDPSMTNIRRTGLSFINCGTQE